MTKLSVSSNAPVLDLFKAFAKEFPKYYVSRQRFTIGESKGQALAKNKKLSEYGLKNGDTLVFKDLGAQVSYRFVYVVEYAGPLFLYPIFMMRPEWAYGAGAGELGEPTFWPVSRDNVVWLAALLWTLHYVKRVAESLFLHKFTNDTMPLPNIFRNSAHYWLAGVLVSYFVNHPLYTAPALLNIQIGCVLWVIGQLGNLQAHVKIAFIRPPGSTEKVMPTGGMFNLVSFPNYFFEVMHWVGFCMITQTFAAYLFLFMGGSTMMIWAAQKHRRYKKLFDGKEGRPLYPRSRKIMFPFVW